jgi:hypothetical protein
MNDPTMRRARCQDIYAGPSAEHGSILICRNQLAKFFELGKTRLSSWDFVTSTRRPRGTQFYELRPWGFNQKMALRSLQYRDGSRWIQIPYLIEETRRRLGLLMSPIERRFAWLERR